jgi:hypothetical protein
VTAAESVEGRDLGEQSAQLGQHAQRGRHACSDPLGPQLAGSQRTVPGGWYWATRVHRHLNLKVGGP